MKQERISGEAGSASEEPQASQKGTPKRRTRGPGSSEERESTLLPEAFFRRVVPGIDDLTELKVTLQLYWRIRDRRRGLPLISRSELLEDTVLSESVRAPGRKPADLIAEGLEKAVGRGTVLQITSGDEAWYLLADEEGHRAAKAIEAGEIALKGGGIAGEAPPPFAEPAVLERPNIFALYEQNIGLLQPLIAEELREAESRYPAEWVEEAFRIAVKQNVRRWRYIQRILERWAEEGRGDRGAEPGSQESRYRYVRGKYADIVKR
ncbi:MAG: DnaD domain-containing protein [Anaerolineae bacterium]